MDVRTLQPETALDDLGAMARQTGQKILRRTLQAQGEESVFSPWEQRGLQFEYPYSYRNVSGDRVAGDQRAGRRAAKMRCSRATSARASAPSV